MTFRRVNSKHFKLCITVLFCALVTVLLACVILALHQGKEADRVTSNSTAASVTRESTSDTETLHAESNTEAESDTDAAETLSDALEQLIDEYGIAVDLELGSQAELISEIISLAASPDRPVRAHIDEDGSSNGIYTPAELAFVYTDLETGACLSYNADTVMYSASLIKAPYVYAVLREIDEFEYNKLNFAADGSPLFSEDGKALFEGKHPNLDDDGNIIYLVGEEKYDLSRTWVYDSATMYAYGSGVIQDEADGFSLTYAELFTYTLKYSDNVAFAQLMRTFGYESHRAMLDELGIAGASEGFMQLSAADCAVYLSEIYEYFNSDSKYAALMKDAMLNADYTVMIPDAVAPTVCAHKYGWDVASYHDMAIVYDEHPFSLVIMTDLDRGLVEDYTYIQDIVAAVLKLHRALGESEV